MNKCVRRVATLGVSAAILLAATSCAKGKATLAMEIKTLDTNVLDFDRCTLDLQDSYDELQSKAGDASATVDVMFEQAITMAIDDAAREWTKEKSGSLLNDSKSLSASADSMINDLAASSVDQARNAYVQVAGINRLEERIKGLERKARDAIRAGSVGQAKEQLAGYVSQENSMLGELQAMVSKSYNTIDSNKGQIISKFIPSYDRKKVEEAKENAVKYETLAGLFEKEQPSLVSNIDDEYAYLVEELGARKEEIQGMVNTRIRKALSNISGKKSTMLQRMDEYRAEQEHLREGIKEVSSLSGEALKTSVSQYDIHYKDVVHDFAQLKTESQALLINSGDMYVRETINAVIAEVVRKEVLDDIKARINTVAEQCLMGVDALAELPAPEETTETIVTEEGETMVVRHKAAGSASMTKLIKSMAKVIDEIDLSVISAEADKDLNVAITGQVGNIETQLKLRVPAVTKELNDLRGYRDNIAKRVSIKPDLPGETDVVRMEAGSVIDEYGMQHDVAAFSLAKYEVTYNLWYDVYQWAVGNGYKFDGKGTQGSDFDAEGIQPTERGKYQPVTNVKNTDAIVWCNAYSEKAGKSPVYTINGMPIKDAHFNINSAMVNSSNDGYRLPTEAELIYAGAFIPTEHRSLDGNSSDAWTWYNSDCGTHNVGTKKAVKSPYNRAGPFYDLHGNAAELATSSTDSVEAIAVNGSWDRSSNNGKYPYGWYHSFMGTVYTPNSQGLRVATF